MYCSNCGSQVNENDKFCGNCGSPIENEELTAALPPSDAETDSIPDLEKNIMKNMENELLFEMQGKQQASDGHNSTYDYISVRNKKPSSPKKEKKKTNKWVVILSVLTAVVVIALAVAAFIVSNPVNKLKSSIKSRDWGRAESVYEKSFSGNEKREDQADELLKHAVNSIKSEYVSGSMDAQTAKRHLKAIANFWDNECVEDALDGIRELEDSRTAFEKAEKCMEDEDYAGAISNFGKVIKSDNRYEEAKGRLETAKSKYKEQVINEAAAYEELKNYEAAIAGMEDALQILPGDADLKERLEELKENQESYAIQSVLDQAQSYAVQGNYYSAMDLLRNTLKNNSGNEKLEEAAEEYQEKYKEDILNKAEAALGTDENYEAGLIVLDSALKTLDGDYPEIEQIIKNKREEYVQAQLEKSKQENASAVITGTWHVTKVASGGTEVSAQLFLLYNGTPDANMRLEIYDTGDFHIDILGETGDGFWMQESAGSSTYLLNIEGDIQSVQIDGSGKLIMDLDDVVLTFEKEVSA